MFMVLITEPAKRARRFNRRSSEHTLCGQPYPRLILGLDDNMVEASVMHRIGVKCFFWLQHADELSHYTAIRQCTRIR